MECDDQLSKMYFEELFGIWFDGQKQNIDYQNVKQSFMEGGFYSHNFPSSNTTVLALNTVLFMKGNECQLDKADN